MAFLTHKNLTGSKKAISFDSYKFHFLSAFFTDIIHFPHSIKLSFQSPSNGAMLNEVDNFI